MEISTLENLVKQELKICERAREDDFYLWLLVADEIYISEMTNKRHQGFLSNKFLYDVMDNAKELGLPPFESVTRARRKIQRLHPELVSQKVKEERELKAAKMREYYKKTRSPEDYKSQEELRKRYANGDTTVAFNPITLSYIEIDDGMKEDYIND